MVVASNSLLVLIKKRPNLVTIRDICERYLRSNNPVTFEMLFSEVPRCPESKQLRKRATWYATTIFST